MVNRENVLKVAEAIETGALVERGIGFNMARYGAAVDDIAKDHIDNCGTVCCIAGYALALKRPDISGEDIAGEHFNIEAEATRYLGLDLGDAGELFLPQPPYSRPWNQIDHQRYLAQITPAQAVRVLRHLAETGEVDWSIADKAAV